MVNFGIKIYFVFILLIIITILFKKKPIMIAALGSLSVGFSETKNFFEGIEVAFRGLLLTAAELLPIILLIGLVLAMTSMLKETETDKILIQPLQKIKNTFVIYWLLGIILLALSLFIWPTPAVILLGTVILPLINYTKIPPLGLAIGLCIFGEGIGLAGDFIIQGAPGLTARSAGVELTQILASSVPLVTGSGLLAAVIGYWQFVILKKNRVEASIISKEQEQKKQEKSDISQRRAIGDQKRKLLAFITLAIYFLLICGLLFSGIRGDRAAAVTGGMTMIVLIIGCVLPDYKISFNVFVKYFQSGLKHSMEVFAPIVVIAGFFLLGTQEGNEKILLENGPGYLEQFALGLSHIILLNGFTCTCIIVLAAILGGLSGSGFSALPLVGGIAAALGQAANIPVVPLAVLGQVAAIWTDATIVPWGFPAIVSAVTKTDVSEIVRKNVLPWLAVVVFVVVWTIYSL